MSGGWPGLPPVDLGGWADFQRRRLQQAAQERIAQVGATASDWGSEARRRVDALSAGLPGGAQWDADLERIGAEAAASEAQFPAPQEAIGSGSGPLDGFVNQTGTPEGEAITSQLAQTATEQTPGGQFMTNVARNVTQNTGPMTADTPVENLAAMGGLALQNVGAPLPGRWAGKAINPGVVQEGLARAAAEALPGGQTSVLDGATIPNYVPFLGGQTLTRDTPLIGGLTTPDEALPFAAGALDPEDIVGLGNKALRGVDLADEAAGLAATGAERIARIYGGAGVDPNLGLRGRPADAVALGRRAVRPPTGPSAPGAGMTPEQLQQRVRDAEEAMYTWQAGETAEVDYVARLLRQGAPRADWNGLIGSGRVDPDALNRALVAYREEGLSEGDALVRALGTPEEQAANLQIGAAAGGVRQPAGVTKDLLKHAINDLGEADPATGRAARPLVTQSEQGAYKVGRNEPPPLTSKKNAWEYVDKNGRSQWLSTPYEVLFARQLDQNPDVAYWAQSSAESVMETTVRHGGEPKVFTPDFIIVGKDGRVQVVEIKNYGSFRQVPWRVPEKLREAEEFFNSKGVGFSIFVEDQLGRQAMGRLTPDDLLPDANGRMGVVNGFYVANEEGRKVGRFDADAARRELVARLNTASRGWDTNELGYLSGRHPVTQEEYDELLASTHWPEWAGRRERGASGRPAPITPDQRRKIIAAGVGGSDPAEGGFGRAYEFAEPVPPEQGGYDPRWTPHRAFAEFNERQRRKGAPRIAADAVEAYPAMRRAVPAISEEWGKQVADGQHGLTVDPLSGQVGVPGRYAVSIAPGMELEVKGTPDQIHPDRLAMWMAEMEPVLRKVPSARVGFWYDSRNDRTYLDLSIGLDSLEEAEALGQRMSQKAIFDSVTKQDIDLRYPGLPAGRRPAMPSPQEQQDALIRFGRPPVRQQRGSAGVQGAAPGAVPGGAAGAAGAGRGRGAGGLGRGGPGAGAPGPAGDAGPVGDGLGGLEPGGVGQADAPFGTYPPPVPYAGAAGESAADSGLRAAGDAGDAASGAPGAPRGLGQEAAQGGLGGVAGFAYTPEEEDGEEPTLEERLTRGGSLAVAGALGTGRGRNLAAGAGRALTRVPELLSAIPLAAPTSLAANATGGLARSLERVAGVAAEGRPIDALVDAGAMVRSLFSGEALRAGKRALREGPTEANPGMTGAVTPDDLAMSKNWLARGATSGVKANAATDQFWRTLNEAGARAQATRRGLKEVPDPEAYATRAGDFATFTGSNSVVAKKLTEMKQTVRDPNASVFDRSVAGAITGMAPYVMMPERLLRSTIGALIPVESATGMVRAYLRGDKAAAREMRGRMVAGLAATTALTYHYYGGGITGDRPEDANEARRREARGEQWNTIQTPAGRIPSRYLGSFGMQANAVATTLDGARRAQEQGGDPGAVLENGFNAASRWMLDASYLSDLSEFGADVQGPEGAAGALRNVAAGLPSRLTGPVTGAIGAADEYEREAEGFPEQVMMRTGLRSQLPARIDPATGEPQRRRGSGWERYFGTRGSEQSPEGSELARLRVTPRVIGRTEEYLGATRSREDRRKVQQVLGSETNRVVRRTMNATYYKNAKDLDKKKYLEDAVREAAKAAEARLWKQGIRKVGKTDAEAEAELESAF